MKIIEKYAVIIQAICKTGETGKKKLQKLMYLMERKGVKLDLGYTIHFFGPYSSKLDAALHVLENDGVIQIDTSGRTHVIKMGNKPVDESCVADEMTTIEFVLEKFANKTPLELEAITTLDYAAVSLLKGNGTDQDIITEVKKFKGEKFKQDELDKELQILKEYQYVL